MANIITRSVGATAKNSALTVEELDQNFININTQLNALGTGGSGATGGGTDQVFIQNDKIVYNNYTIPDTKNAFTIGPITINDGAVITIPSATAWTIYSDFIDDDMGAAYNQSLNTLDNVVFNQVTCSTYATQGSMNFNVPAGNAYIFNGSPIQVPKFNSSGISSIVPVDGYMVYDTTVRKFKFYENGSWVIISNASGAIYDQSLNTTNSVTFASVSATSVSATSVSTDTVSTPAVNSSAAITLNATTVVKIADTPFRLASFTTSNIATLTSVNGDMLYDSTLNKFKLYENGTWVTLASGGTGGGGGGTAYNQSLNTTDAVTFASLSTAVINSDTEINLNATTVVKVADTPLRLANISNINAITPSNGDMVYDTTAGKFRLYENGGWTGLTQSSLAISTSISPTSDTWYQVPTMFRIVISGTGTVTVATKDVGSAIVNNAFVYVVSAVSNEIHSFVAEEVQYIKITYANNVSVLLTN